MSGPDACRSIAVAVLGLGLITVKVCITTLVLHGKDVPHELLAMAGASITAIAWVIYHVGSEGPVGLSRAVEQVHQLVNDRSSKQDAKSDSQTLLIEGLRDVIRTLHEKHPEDTGGP